MVFILCTVSFFENSYSTNEDDEYSIFVQTQVRDVNDNLIIFLELHEITIRDKDLLNKFLDTQNVVEILEENGEKMELIKVITTLKIDHFSSIANTALAVQGNDSRQIVVAYTNHDAFLIMPGDFVIAEWTIKRQH